jgi:NDP-sugar pyrophosphorylase family protein
VRAKPAVPVAGEPLIRRILRYASRQGVRDFVLNLHALPETITARVGDGADLEVRVRYSFESPVLGSAGGPRRALALLPDDDFFIVNGDTLTSVDLGALAERHRESKALVTIAVIPNEWPDRYGGLVVDREGRFHSVVPRGSHVHSYHVVGVQMAHPAAFASLDPNQPAESIGALYKLLVRENPGQVRAVLCATDFWDIGTPSDYLTTALAIGKAEGHEGAQIGARSVVDPSARVVDSVIWDDVVVGNRVTLERCIVADGVTIESGADFQDCAIVWKDGELRVAKIA